MLSPAEKKLTMGYKNDMKREESAVQEAASGLESIQNLMRLFSTVQQHHLQSSSSTPSSSCPAETDYRAVADAAVSKFKNVISLLSPGRIGHARFRRAPLAVSPPSSSGRGNITNVIQSKGSNSNNKNIDYCYQAEPIRQIFPPSHQLKKMVSTISFNFSASSSAPNSFTTSLTSDQTGENSLSRFSCCKRKCTSSDISGSGKCGNSSSGRCHCSKRRKMRTKRVVRVPAISLKLADIPPDDFSWRKYGQKPIKGSPHPRGYYKCSSLRGCPARKHVERALDDPTMLIVTYECEHNHSISIADSSALILESS